MRKYVLSIFILLLITSMHPVYAEAAEKELNIVEPDTYGPTLFPAFNIKEQMTLSPMFTPDNALEIHAAWIAQANSTIELQNQYITQFDDSVSWAEDPNPLIRELVKAKQRDVIIRVQVREESDSDDVGGYLSSLGISVRYMGSSTSTPDDSYLSYTHNKMLLIDGKVSLISSINYGESAFTINREAGMVIQSSSVTQYYLSVFEEDWEDGELVASTASLAIEPKVSLDYYFDFSSHTDIPKSNFTGVYNVTAFVNPDNADEVIFDYLKSAKESIYVSMYTISRADFNNTLIDLKKANPSIDIQVLISTRRVGGSENVDTKAAAESLVENLIPVYNASVDAFDSAAGFYHNKYWIIDGKHTFVYSGNWSPRSVTPQEEDNTYASGDPNRDMGIVVADAPDIAAFYTNVWSQDVNVADAWELPVGIAQTSFSETDVVSGNIALTGTTSGLNVTEVNYAFNDVVKGSIPVVNETFSASFDTTTLENGVTSFEVFAFDVQNYTDEVTINVVNIGTVDNWRVLISEVHSDPSVVSDTEGEFFELTNSFPFDVLIGTWKIGDDNDVFEIPEDYIIPAYTSLIFARNSDGFNTAYSQTADFEISMSLVNSGDYIRFQNHKGEFIDVVAYGDETAPDGSESVAAPSAGKSISRVELYIDTDTAADFEEQDVSPKDVVPQVPLGTTSTITGTSSTTEETSSESQTTETLDVSTISGSSIDDLSELEYSNYSWFMSIFILIGVPIILRRRR
ncbi:MAG: lamin tail domain-containing protein [Candidatus Heimdallarchaeota archaeon]|nr:lamin tail domain-containing protein [Candidatus Heimdallarchaeota archaeon]